MLWQPRATKACNPAKAKPKQPGVWECGLRDTAEGTRLLLQVLVVGAVGRRKRVCSVLVLILLLECLAFSIVIAS